MTTPRSVTFETASIADAVSKATRVAPTKGAAFDRSAGILFELRPSDPTHTITVKATNLDVTYLQWIDPISMEGDEGDWRVPSTLLAGILAGLPMGAGQKVVIAEKANEKDVLIITSGKIKAKIRTMPDVGSFVRWDPFDPVPLVNVAGFATRVAQASWACDRETAPYTGVHIDGTHIVATDRYRLVKVPCTVPVDEPITVPLDVIAPIMRNLTDARVRAHEGRLQIMPDSHTQITSTIFGVSYPVLAPITDVTPKATMTLDRDILVDAMNRMLVLAKGERYPVSRLTVGNGAIEVHMNVPEVGEMEDTVSVAEGAAHDPYTIYFTPQNLVEGLNHASNPKVIVGYDPTSPRMPWRVDDGSGYLSWIVPRRMTETGEPAK